MYVITGASGNTGSRVSEILLDKGKKVRVIGRNPDRLKALSARGGEAFIADLADTAKLIRAFEGAEAVYAMIPPDLAQPAYHQFQDRISEALAAALVAAHVPYAVTLSSVGADKAQGTGPVVGLFYLEQKLNAISGLNVLHLRTGYFMENTLAQVEIIPGMGSAAGPLRPDLKLPMIATRDIGAVAADALLRLGFRGHQTRELLGPRDLTYPEASAIIGKAIGKPGLQYVQLSDAQMRPALEGMGMSPDFVQLLLEMCVAMNSGHMRALEPRSPENTTPTTYETFVAEKFVPAYKQQLKAA